MRRSIAIVLLPCLAAWPANGAAPGDHAPPPPAFATTAPIALMLDANAGRVLFARAADRRFMPASLTKIMTAYVAMEMLTRGELRLDQPLPVRDETWAAWHARGTVMHLVRGSSVAVADLLRGIVTVSANDACVVLAEGAAGSVPAFTARMNATAQRLGLTNSHFESPNGWPDGGRTYVSARDLAVLSQDMIDRFPTLYHQFFGMDRMSWAGITQANHMPLYGFTRGADGVKTGFHRQAGYGIVGSAQRDGRRVIMVLGAMDSEAARAREARAFIEWAYAAWDARLLAGAGTRFGEALVQGGEARRVGLIAAAAVFAARPAALPGAAPAAAPHFSVRYRGPLVAPLARGERVATLLVQVPGQPDGEVPLLAEAGIGRGGAWARLRNGLFALVGR